MRWNLPKSLRSLPETAAELPEIAAEPAEAVAEPPGIESTEPAETAAQPPEPAAELLEIAAEGTLKEQEDAGRKSGQRHDSETILLPAVELKEATPEALRKRPEFGLRDQTFSESFLGAALLC